MMAARLGGLPARRKAFLAAVALILLAAVVTVTVTVTASNARGRPPAGYPAQARPGPVLLVPGYGGSITGLSMLAARIQAAGRPATVVRLPGNGTGSLVRDAAALNQAVTRALRAGAPSVDVIGYSAGGVTTLLWARDDDGARRARRIVTLGAPFHGTAVAGAAAGFDPGACPAACQQLVPGSVLLNGLARGAPRPLRWLSLWTTDDQTVVPPDSARLAGAVNVPVQSVCPGQRIAHSQLPTSAVVTAMVLQVIGTGPLGRPAAAACQAR